MKLNKIQKDYIYIFQLAVRFIYLLYLQPNLLAENINFAYAKSD